MDIAKLLPSTTWQNILNSLPQLSNNHGNKDETNTYRIFAVSHTKHLAVDEKFAPCSVLLKTITHSMGSIVTKLLFTLREGIAVHILMCQPYYFIPEKRWDAVHDIQSTSFNLTCYSKTILLQLHLLVILTPPNSLQKIPIFLGRTIPFTLYGIQFRIRSVQSHWSLYNKVTTSLIHCLYRSYMPIIQVNILVWPFPYMILHHHVYRFYSNWGILSNMQNSHLLT